MDKKKLGNIEIVPSNDVMAGEVSTWIFKITVGSYCIEKGGGIRLLFPHGFSVPILLPEGWPPSDTEENPNHKEFNAYDNGFVTIKHPENCKFEYYLMNPDESFKHAVQGQNGRFLFLNLVEGRLNKGDVVKIVYGDIITGSAGAVAPSISHVVEFSCAINPDGKHKESKGYWQIDSPRVKILGTALHHYDVIAPSQTNKDGKIKLAVVAKDRYNNPCSDVNTEIFISKNNEDTIKKTINIKGWNSSLVINNITIDDASTRIIVRDRENKLEAKSNLIEKNNYDDFNIYWGDLHCHIAPDFSKELSQDLFDYARNITNLDFCAFTPHEDFPVKLTEKSWETARQVVSKNYSPGSFVTFSGYEYRNRGDYIVLYDRDDQPFMPGMMPASNTIDKLYEFIKTEVTSRCMLIPHLHYLAAFHESGAEIGVLDLNDLINEYIRNVEIYSMHGSAEYQGCIRSQSGALAKGHSPRINEVLNKVLKTGIKLGFTGDTDTHTGNPGYSKWLRNRVQYQGGVTAVYAQGLTRNEIWEGLWNHRTYATTGARMRIDFKTNDVRMGGTVKLKGGGEKCVIKSEVKGTDIIDNICVMRGDREVYKAYFNDEEANLVWEDNESTKTNTYYYVRVIQKDGNIGWASPVWVQA